MNGPQGPQAPQMPQMPQGGGPVAGAMQGMTPEQIQQLVAAGIVPEQNAELAKQYQYQQALRNKEGPQGATTRGIYQASSPLEHLGSYMEKRGAQKQMPQIQGQMQQNRQSQADARTQYILEILKNQGAQGAGGMGGAAGAPAGMPPL